MISDDQMLLTVKAAEYRLRIFTAEKHISNDIYRTASGNAAVPVFDKGFIHLFYRFKWAAAEFQHVCVPDMCICYKKHHVIIPHFGNSISHAP